MGKSSSDQDISPQIHMQKWILNSFQWDKTKFRTTEYNIILLLKESLATEGRAAHLLSPGLYRVGQRKLDLGEDFSFSEPQWHSGVGTPAPFYSISAIYRIILSLFLIWRSSKTQHWILEAMHTRACFYQGIGHPETLRLSLFPLVNSFHNPETPTMEWSSQLNTTIKNTLIFSNSFYQQPQCFASLYKNSVIVLCHIEEKKICSLWMPLRTSQSKEINTSIGMRSFFYKLVFADCTISILF